MSKKISTSNYKPGLDIEFVKEKYHLKDVIKLASNENPCGPSEIAIKAFDKEIRSLNRYPDGKCTQLKKQLVKSLSRRFVKQDNIIVGNGSSEIIELIGKTFSSSNDEILFSKHSFIVYKLVANFTGSKVIESKLITKHGKEFMSSDLDDMYKKITKKTKVIFIANPANPTGAIISNKKIDDFISKVSTKIIIVIDEAYIEYACERGHKSAINLVNKFKNIIVTRSFSKIYALAGTRIGYGIANKDLISKLNNKRQPFNVNMVAQAMARASLKDPKFLKRSLITYNSSRLYLYKQFDKLSLKYIDSYANFITIYFGKNVKRVFNELLKNGIILRPLENYGLQNYLRMTIGNIRECRKFVKILKNILGVSDA